MKIEYSAHAKARLKQRKISKNKILQVIKNPSETDFSYRDRRIYRKKFSDIILEVVTTNEDDKLIVVTAYYL